MRSSCESPRRRKLCSPTNIDLSTLALADRGSSDSNRTEKVAAIAAEIHALGLYPGIIIAATTPDGKTIDYQVGHADLDGERPVTSRTTFRMYSVSKGLTRILAAVLVDKGHARS